MKIHRVIAFRRKLKGFSRSFTKNVLTIFLKKKDRINPYDKKQTNQQCGGCFISFRSLRESVFVFIIEKKSREQRNFHQFRPSNL